MDYQLLQNINEQKALPIEIIHIILVYLRNPQDPQLLEDISSFSRTMTNITKIHYDKWITKLKYKPGIDIMWLENNVLLYANDQVPTRFEIQPKFKEIIARFININKDKYKDKYKDKDKDNKNFQNYVYSNKISLKTRVNILWGLFTVKERDDFIQIYRTEYS
jgi:hypothetical protein